MTQIQKKKKKPRSLFMRDTNAPFQALAGKKRICLWFWKWSILSTDCPPQFEHDLTGPEVMKKWKPDDFICRNEILDQLHYSVYNIYCDLDTAKDLWEALKREYLTEYENYKKLIHEVKSEGRECIFLSNFWWPVLFTNYHLLERVWDIPKT